MTDQSSTQRVDAFFFDLDGTLVDTAADFISVLNHQRQLHQLVPLDATLIRNTVSNGARALTALAFGGQEGDSVFEARRQELLDLYEEKVGQSARLFPGYAQLLGILRDSGRHWGIITNKPRRYTELLLQRMHLACPILICPDDVQESKPDPEGLLRAANLCAVDPSRCVYVGDHQRDIEAARNAGMISVAARYGYIPQDESPSHWDADHIIDHPNDLLPLFLS